METFTVPVVAFLTAWAVTTWLASKASPFTIMDAPGERSLHAHPVPRGGGLGILSGLLAASVLRWGLGFGAPVALLVVGTGLIATISLADDLRDIPPLIRLGIHVTAAVLLVVTLNGKWADWWLYGLLVLLVVWMINLYNFMDGMDGFAGGMGVWGFGFLALCGWLQGQEEYALSTLIVAAANLGFLLCNFPPARIFMGDVGSATMGFLAAAYSISGISQGWLPAEVPLLIFSPFIVDATVTLFRRLLNRERVWEAHRTHYYQKLVRSGWSHRRTVLAEYALMLGSGMTATLLLKYQSIASKVALLGAWGLFYGVAILLVRSVERTGRESAA